jgi:hypothetical protein
VLALDAQDGRFQPIHEPAIRSALDHGKAVIADSLDMRLELRLIEHSDLPANSSRPAL